MEVNPYQPPIVAVPTLAEEVSAGDRPAPRPIGIWILSGLHLLVGLLFLAMFLILLWQLSTDRTIRLVVPGLVIVLFGLIVGMAAATTIGMWLGAKWGWWLTAFYYVWATLGVVADSLFMLLRLEEVDPEWRASFATKQSILFVVHGLILLYLFKRTVRDFFRLKSQRMVTALAILATLAIVVMGATYGVLYSQSADGP